MPVTPIIFRTTQAGRDAAANAINNLPNGKLSLTTVKIGSGKYPPPGNETALQNPYADEFSIGGGGVQAGSGQIRFTPIMNSTARIEVFEIGLFGDAASGNVLFAIASTPSATVPLCVIEANIETIFSMNVGFEDIDAGSIDLVVDVNAPLALSLMGTHVAAAHPHSQYKRTNDNSERLKVANAVDADEAVSKAQLDALAGSSGGSSSNLQAQIDAEEAARIAADNNLQQQIDAEEAARIAADNNLQAQINGKADLAGNAFQQFNVGPVTLASHAVPFGQMVIGTVYSNAANGYLKLPNWLGGFILQWGINDDDSSAEVTVNFDPPFSSLCFVVLPIGDAYYNTGAAELVNITSITKTSFLWCGAISPATGTIPAGVKGRWFAIGY